MSGNRATKQETLRNGPNGSCKGEPLHSCPLYV